MRAIHILRIALSLYYKVLEKGIYRWYILTINVINKGGLFMLKKAIALIISLAMVMSILAVSVSAEYTVEGDLTEYPVIMIPGYSGTELIMVNDDGSETRIWGVNMDSILDRVVNRIADLGKGLVLTIDGNPEYLGKTVGEELEAELEYMKMNPDGTSKYNIKIENESAQRTNMAYIHENGLSEDYIYEPSLSAEMAEYIGEENIFFFTEDWRTSVYDCAVRLDGFIQEVKAITGKDKVNLVAVSHGGQVTATYLSLFGYKQDVNNAVLTVPAIGGAALAYDIMSGNAALDEETLAYYLEHGFDAEGHYAWLLEAQQLGFLDDIVQELLPYVYNVIGNFGSIWDFIPLEYYDEVKAMHLDPVENAAIIEKSDYVHYEIMANYHENLQRCMDEYNIDIYIIAGTGVHAVSGLDENSDAIICTDDSTGAKCAPYGLRYSDGFTGARTQCDNPDHDHVSPSMEIDASTAFLPENTWFVEGLYHGMTFHDEYSRSLTLKTLLTEEIEDIYSDPAYPQFRESTNVNNGVYVRFKNSPAGYVSGNDKYIVIKNVSKEYSLKISSVEIMGADLVVHSLGVAALEPGEEVSLQVTGKLPEVSNALLQVNVNYSLEGNLTAPIGKKLVSFKMMNGESPVYDETNPYVAADYTTGYEDAMGDADDILVNFGLSYLISYIYQMIMSFLDQIGVGMFLK